MPAPNVADPAAIAAVQDILKEVWTTDALEDQLMHELILFDWIDDVQEFTDSDGLKASVPLRTGRTGGISSRGIGEPIGAAGHQGVGKVSYNYKFHYLTIKVLGPVIARMKTSRQACIKELELEVDNGLEDLKQDWQRQMHGDGSAVIGTYEVTSGSAVLVPTTGETEENTIHAAEVGWVYEDMPVQVGTAAAPQQLVGRVLSVDDETGEVTLDTAAAVTGTKTLTRYGNRIAAGQVSHEMNGLGNIIGEGALGVDGNGAAMTAALHSYWKSTIHANGGTERANSLDLMLRVDNALRRKGGKAELLLGSLDQHRRFYLIMEQRVRFIGEKDLSQGNARGLEFNDKTFVGDPHALRGSVNFLNKKGFQMYSAGDIAWQNKTTGGDILVWEQGYDAFVAQAAKYCQLGSPRRNILGRLDDLLET